MYRRKGGKVDSSHTNFTRVKAPLIESVGTCGFSRQRLLSWLDETERSHGIG